MRIDCVRHRTEYVLELSRTEVTLLSQVAKHHYDGKCKDLAEPGGLLHTMLKIMDNMECNSDTHVFQWSDLDIMCKVLEQLDYMGLPSDGELWQMRLRFNWLLRSRELMVIARDGAEVEKLYPGNNGW